MNLPDLSLLRLDFRLRAKAPVKLPPYLGSTLRGALGRALNRVFCFVPHETSENCWFRQACPYQYIFESKNLGNIPKEKLHKFLRGQEYFPSPFVLIAPELRSKRGVQNIDNSTENKIFNDDFYSNRFSTGDRLNFSILLIGKAVHHWAHVVVAVRLLAEIGLGEERKRTPFTLMEAFAHDSSGKRLRVYDEETKQIFTCDISTVKLKQIVEIENKVLAAKIRESGGSSVRIKFLSPVNQRILVSGKNGNITEAKKNGLYFHTLIKKITERIEFMANLYAEPSQNINYHSLLSDAESVRITDKLLKYYIYEQHSEDSNEYIPRDVFTGEIVYQGESLPEFLPYLAAGEILNVGKDTLHGFGRFAI